MSAGREFALPILKNLEHVKSFAKSEKNVLVGKLIKLNLLIPSETKVK
jgi:hypothetical protein